MVRAELPGFDSDKHIAVTARGGLLTITADWQARESGNGRSEFSYGTFGRATALPAGADSSAITAKYTDGILEVSMPHAEHPSDKYVTIQVAKPDSATGGYARAGACPHFVRGDARTR
jgi:HSP20 family protein